jgi:hypothetical protein
MIGEGAKTVVWPPNQLAKRERVGWIWIQCLVPILELPNEQISYQITGPYLSKAPCGTPL